MDVWNTTPARPLHDVKRRKLEHEERREEENIKDSLPFILSATPPHIGGSGPQTGAASAGDEINSQSRSLEYLSSLAKPSPLTDARR